MDPFNSLNTQERSSAQHPSQDQEAAASSQFSVKTPPEEATSNLYTTNRADRRRKGQRIVGRKQTVIARKEATPGGKRPETGRMRSVAGGKKGSPLQYIVQNKKKAATIFAACLFVFILILYSAKALGWLDNSIQGFIASVRPTGSNAFVTVFFKNMTAYMNPYVLALLLFVIAAFGPKNHPAFSGFLDIAGIFIINEVVKVLVARPRPSGTHLIAETGYAFPSGHSVIAMAFFGFVIWLVWKSLRGRTFWRWCLTVLFSALIVLVGVSRVYLNVHFASDVIAGWCLGFVWLSFFTSVCAPRLMSAPQIFGGTEISGEGVGETTGAGAGDGAASRQSFGETLEWRRQKKVLRKLGVSADDIARSKHAKGSVDKKENA